MISISVKVEISIPPQHSSALRIQDSGPHNSRRTTKRSLAKNTPALQAIKSEAFVFSFSQLKLNSKSALRKYWYPVYPSLRHDNIDKKNLEPVRGKQES